MPQRDLSQLLERGAARPHRSGDVEEVWRRGQRRRRRNRAAVAVGSALAIVAVVVFAATLRQGSPAPFIQPAPDSTHQWGPLAVVPGPPSGSEALIHGTLQVTGQCVTLDERGDDVLLVWPADATTWNPGQRTITYTNRDGSSAVLRDGMEVSFGGGGDSSAEGGEPPQVWADRIDWVSPPASGCLTDTRWWINEVVASPDLGTTASPSSATVRVVDAHLDDDGRTLSLALGVCNADSHDVEVVETDDTVRIRASARGGTGDSCADEALVTLEQPLGDRVIIDVRTGERVEPT